MTEEEKMWICVIIQNGRIDMRQIDTISFTRKHAYEKLAHGSSYSLKQLKSFGWKAIKVTLAFQLD